MTLFDRLRLAFTVLVLATVPSWTCADTMLPRNFIAREGKGYLERVGPQFVLHLKGSPEEMGRQHGALLKDEIRALVSTIEKGRLGPAAKFGNALFDTVWRLQTAHTPERYAAEIEALANGCGLPVLSLRRCNTIPEFFHCSGFALWGGATKNGTLYHGRILDYAVDLGLQEHSVVIIAEPDGLIPFVNVTYAGFVGSVTGMNLKGIGFGEMGGGGEGQWEGTPMAFLMRRGLEESSSLDSAKNLFRQSKRTCEYYYVFSDANVPCAVGVAATPGKIEFAGPNEVLGPLGTPIKDAIVLSADDRYKLLCKRITGGWGTLDAPACRELMRRPVAMKHCLHTVLMSPKTRELWVAHATSKGEPASEQSYAYLDIRELMMREP